MYNLHNIDNNINVMKRFFIYGFIGCSMEVFWTGIASLFKGDSALMSHSSIWMIVIYGMAIFLEPFQDALKNKHCIIRGLVYMSLIYATEYITGFALNIFDIKVWEYTDAFNLHGYITLYFAPLWFTVGLFYEKVRMWLDNVSEIDRELVIDKNI